MALRFNLSTFDNLLHKESLSGLEVLTASTAESAELNLGRVPFARPPRLPSFVAGLPDHQ